MAGMISVLAIRHSCRPRTPYRPERNAVQSRHGRNLAPERGGCGSPPIGGQSTIGRQITAVRLPLDLEWLASKPARRSFMAILDEGPQSPSFGPCAAGASDMTSG